ncbi:MAG: DUF4153 domain-containing protein, partial [Sphingomonadales bacterium]
GILREHSNVVRLLQRVVTLVLSVLAPVLAVGLIVFVLALPFTGLAPLWEAGSATGILLACILGSFVLSNSVIGSARDEERQFPLLKYGAMGLALVMLPLAILAAVAIGLRIGQYGFTPERLWALTFVILACSYGAAYLVSLVRGRLDWATKVRPANLNLAFATCGVALLLATPLVSFNAIATHDQVSRLQSGKTPPGKFDWRALAFAFGEPGKAALKKLQASANADIRERAIAAGKAETVFEVVENQPTRAEVAKQLRVLPVGAVVPDAALDALTRERCTAGANGGCTVLIADPGTIVLMRDNCFAANKAWPCTDADIFTIQDSKWSQARSPIVSEPGAAKATADAQAKAYAGAQLEVREIKRRQVFVGGKPVGEVFE